MTERDNLENISCPLCSSEKQKCAYDFSPYEVKRCLDCGFYFLSPRMPEEEIIKIYEGDDYFDGGESGYTDVNYLDQEASFRKTFMLLMRNMKKRGLTGGSLLDIGCAYGYLLDEAKGYFDYRAGMEFSDQAISVAVGHADKIYKGGVEALSADDKFDCIITTHVIEHVYEPVSFVQQMYKHLKPGGKMIITTPDIGSFWRHLMRKRWSFFKIPEHILFFDNRSLSALMQKAGLTNIGSFPYPHAFPVTLISKKFGISLPESLNSMSLTLPKTTVAMYGYREE